MLQKGILGMQNTKYSEQDKRTKIIHSFPHQFDNLELRKDIDFLKKNAVNSTQNTLSYIFGQRETFIQSMIAIFNKKFTRKISLLSKFSNTDKYLRRVI